MPHARLRKRGPWVTALLLFASALALAPATSEAGDGEWLFGVHGFGAMMRTSVTQWGGGGGLHGAYGVSTAWSLAASVSYRGVGGRLDSNGDPVPGRHLVGGVVGAQFALDVFRVMPFLTGGIGVYAVVAADGSGVKVAPAAELGLTVDYAVSRTIYIGLDIINARVMWLDRAPAWGFEFGLRATYVIW